MGKQVVKVIGAGLAGCEAAWQLAKRGVQVELIECKPIIKSAAHSLDDFCELVCSNSLKSLDPNTAHGLLKTELEMLDSVVLAIAKESQIPAGSALAVDRNVFAKAVTQRIKAHPNITVTHQLVSAFDKTQPTIIATGPLTLGDLANQIKTEFDGHLSFYDAAAPIVSYESIDFDSAFVADRYGKGSGDYINCPLERDEYYALVEALNVAERAELKEFEKDASGEIPVFEGCIPIEILAKRGRDTMRFGPLKPVGIVNPKTDRRPFAVVQLRSENASCSLYNMVGFQTNLKFGEQKRVFSLIPALKNAEFLRYGVMHRNTYVDAPRVLNASFSSLKYPNVFIAGQLAGVEGYVESVASGLVSGIHMAAQLSGKRMPELPNTTMLGALCRHITTPNPNFQPMNANYGLMSPIVMRDKAARKEAYATRAVQDLKEILVDWLQ